MADLNTNYTMNWYSSICLASIVGLLMVVSKWVFLKRSRAPPGPMPLPLIGNLLYIARQDAINYIALHKISKKYGDIVSLRIGSMSNIVISSSKVAKDLYSRPECLNRPINGPLFERTLNQNIGMAFSNDDNWDEIRKFSKKALRDFGFGNRMSMESLIKNELKHLIKHMEEQLSHSKTRTLYFDKYFQVSFLNLIASLLTGNRHSYDNPEFKMLVEASNAWFAAPLLGVLTVMAFPWTRFLFPKLLGYETQTNALKTMYNYCWSILEKHRQTKIFLKEPKCFTDSFLKMQYEQTNQPSSIYTDDQFAVLCTDLIQGGSDTTSNWLSFAILLLMLNPEAQKKVADEIEAIIGLNRLPELKDKDNMMYTQAVMYEVHRFARLTITLPPRVSGADFRYRDYIIRKNTIILINLHSCYMDPDVWEDPENFRPERFLDGNGQLANLEKMSIIFGAGKRSCFGEAMGRDGSFLYLTILLQKFSFEVPSNYATPEAQPVPSLILHPKPYHVRIERRNSIADDG